PWDAISSYTAPLPQPETFEVYPNRDSLPFMDDYHFGEGWRIKEFVRGTLRLNGWQEAWADVFAEIETLEGAEGDARLKEMSDQFWADHAYDEDEPDRVILCVELKAELDGKPVYHKTYTLDAWGDARGTAMARLVSETVALAVEAVLERAVMVGVSTAPHDPQLLGPWLESVNRMAQHVQIVDHLR
ncbi:MAG: saccharopine dehydrogenase, partial [Litoreibacter sp.]|nr:saccharopine dehydrogenase [Litoreibacter sp.]